MIKVKVVGKGCPNCRKLEAVCKEVITENNLDVSVEKVSDINEFADLGVMMTPGLIINDVVVSQGKIPDKKAVLAWLGSVAY